MMRLKLKPVTKIYFAVSLSALQKYHPTTATFLLNSSDRVRAILGKQIYKSCDPILEYCCTHTCVIHETNYYLL